MADEELMGVLDFGVSADPGVWQEYERRKRELPPMGPDEYETAIKAICEELSI